MSGSERWIVVGVGLLAGVGLLVFLIFGLGIFSSEPTLDREPRDEPRSEATPEPREPSPMPTERRSSQRTKRAEKTEEPPVASVASLTGRAVLTDKSPMAGAAVTLYLLDPNNRVPIGVGEPVAGPMYTDSAGEYAVFDLPAGSYGLLARKEGYTEARMTGIKIEEGKTRRLRDLIFNIGGSISGHVNSADGGSIAGARVVALLQKKLGLSVMEQNGPHAITDGSGFYEIQNVPPGVRNVFAGAEGYATAMALEVTIEDGQPTPPVDFSLVAGKQITGNVFELETLAPIEGATVVASPVVFKDPTRGQGLSDDSGFFTLEGLSQWSYRLRVTKKGYVPSGLQIAASGMHMEFFLTKNGGARGQVVDAATGAGIPSFKLRFGDASGDSIQGIGKTVTFDDVAGNFEVYDLNPKTYVFEAWADGYTYARTEPMELAKGQWLDGIVISLGKGATVRGQVIQSLDGSPVAGAPVEIRPDDPRPAFIMKSVNEGYVKSTRTDSEGRFEVVGVGPGKYRADVVHETYRNYEGTVFESTEGANIDLGRIAVDLGGTIQGTITLADGSPVPHAQMLINGTDIEYRNRAKSDEGGYFEFTRLPPGAFLIEVERIKGRMRNKADVASFPKLSARVAEGETVNLSF